MDMDKIAKQMEASQRKMEELQSQLSTLSGNSPDNHSDTGQDVLEEAEQLFDVVFEGRPLPGIPLEKAIAGLARLSRKKPEAVAHFFNEHPRILKRKVPEKNALQYHQALQNAGLACHIVNVGSPSVADETKKSSDLESPPLSASAKRPCNKCGVMILPATGKKTGGLCMTCYKNSPDYKPPPEKVTKETPAKDTPKDMVVGATAVIATVLGVVAGLISYVMQFSEMWEDAGMILTLVAFPLFPLGGALIGGIIGFIIGWIVYLIASPFISETKK